ncbi:hypothetical protein HJC23_004149 [Cyclotella cryptica]|uniref:Uncharacterized protein n=1 Tax=Cyclotella cryptica TaxID=29204 RepID=A0ABD3PLM8_9STRA
MNGARFDSNGFCIAHPNTRLCKPTDDGKYKIVRKTCQRCGSAALMSDPRTVKTNVHGYKRKPSKHREIQGLLTASGGNHGSDTQNRSGRSHSRRALPTGVTHSSETKQTRGRSRSNSEHHSMANSRALPSSRGERQMKKILRQSSHGTRGSIGSVSCLGLANENEFASADGRAFSGIDPRRSTRRSRTLSPLPKVNGITRGRTLSPVRKDPSNTKPTSYFKKVSEELAPRHVKEVLHAKLSKRNSKVHTHETEVPPDHAKRYEVPFNQNGYCIFHPDVHLAKKDKKGVWRVIQDLCPECNESSKPPRSRSSSLNRKSGKVIRAVKQLKDAERNINGTHVGGPNETALVVVNPRRGKVREAKVEATTNETALVVYSKKGKEGKSSGLLKKSASYASLTSATHSPDSVRSGPSPAFSSSYFTGTTTGFPTLPLVSDELNVSHADTLKHSNAMAASTRRRSRSKPRIAEMSG